MCVIMLVNDTRPTTDMIERAWNTNDDGAGAAWREKGEVHWEKGLMEKDGGLERMKEFAKKLPTPFVLHFRIASNGGICKQLTHPFPIGADASVELRGRTKGKVLFHNGHWNAWADRALEAAINSNTPIPEGGEWSDTRAMGWLCHIYGTGFMKFLPSQKGIVMGPNTMEISPGDGWTKVNDVWCSNDFFVKRGGRTVYSNRLCSNNSCAKPVEQGKNFCSEHAALPAVNPVPLVRVGNDLVEVKQEPVPFQRGELLSLGQAEALFRQRAISRTMLKKFRQEYHRLTGKGQKAEKAKKKLLLHSETVMTLLSSRGLPH